MKKKILELSLQIGTTSLIVIVWGIISTLIFSIGGLPLLKTVERWSELVFIEKTFFVSLSTLFGLGFGMLLILFQITIFQSLKSLWED